MQLTQCKNGWLAQQGPGVENITYYPTLLAAARVLEEDAPSQGVLDLRPAASPEPQPAPDKAPKRRGRPPKAAAPKPTPPASPAAPESEPPQPAPTLAATPPAAPSAPAAAAADVATLDDARTALAALNSKHGMVLAKSALARYGCNRIGELKSEQYAGFIALCKQAVQTGEV